MSKTIIHQQLDVYRENYLKHGDSPKGVRNNDSETQGLRFERIIKQFDTSKPFSIHDIGAGTATLHKYLTGKKIKHLYHGSEIVKEMVSYTQKKYPGIKMYHRDILADTKVQKCDWVVSSGTFYIKGETPGKTWEAYIYKMIKRMFEISNNGISFNLLTAYNTFESPELAYFNPREVLDFCHKNLSRYVIIDHSYPLYEFTTTVLKSSYMKKCYPTKAFAKYFKNDK